MKSKIIAELLGTALLLAVVTGSGVMGESLAAGNTAVALLGNSIATGCGLYVLITVLGPISGAHFNPLVSLMMWQANVISLKNAIGYITAQCIGAILGVWLTHLMFGLSLIEVSSKSRSGAGQWLSELASTMILLTLIRLALKYASEKVAMLVAMTVTAGYWFTSSTFFANPAVTIARTLTDTFVGIAPADLLLFISAQFAALLFTVFWMKLESK
ncbi:MAG: MIP/aquaporin family protein [Methylophilus sp.]|nr:MIP/aquaporin family protein [Methylophilus sp.]